MQTEIDLWSLTDEMEGESLVDYVLQHLDEKDAIEKAYELKQDMVGILDREGYLPALDLLSNLRCRDNGGRILPPESNTLPARDYVRTITDAVRRINRHMHEGLDRGYYLDQTILHDEICGTVMDDFQPKVMMMVRFIFGYFDFHMPMNWSGYDYHKPWADQSEALHEGFEKRLKDFAERLREVREEFLGEGWLEDGSLEFEYLMQHAEKAIWGRWREEDEMI